jgi:hypothetical protein
MTLHIITGSSAAARLDTALAGSDDILLLENARIWNQHEPTNLDPVEHACWLQRLVLNGRPSEKREFQVPKSLAEVEAVRRGDPICIWSARNLDDATLSLWLFNHLDGLGYATKSISVIRVFCTTTEGDPVSAVDQLSDNDVARFAKEHRMMNANEIAAFRDRWASLRASDVAEFEKLFAFDYSVLKGWQDVFLSVLQRVPSVCWGHAPEAVVLFECLRLANWDEGKAFVQYVTQAPFSPSKLRPPDAKAILAAIRTEAERVAFRLETLDEVEGVLQSANSNISRFCVPFFWRDSLASSLPPGIGARILK